MERLTIGSRFLLRFVSEDVRTNMYIFLDAFLSSTRIPHPKPLLSCGKQGFRNAQYCLRMSIPIIPAAFTVFNVNGKRS